MIDEKEIVFNKEDVLKIVENVVSAEITDETLYEHNNIGKMCNKIIENTMKGLTGLSRPFKYIVTCVIMQNNGAGFHTSSSCLWDTCDGHVISKKESKHMYCITTVYGMAL